MKRSVNQGFIILVLTILLLLSLAILVLYFAPNNDDSEMLVVWGKQNMPGPCFIWLIDPKDDHVSSPIVGEDDCNYRIVDIEGKPTFVYIQRFPGEIKEYAINRSGQLVQQRIIKSENTGISNSVQWGQNDVIYFSNILNGREQIFRLDTNSSFSEPYLTYFAGMAAGPKISPNRHYLAYWTLEKVANHNECLTCSNGQYRIYNLENETDLGLSDLVNERLKFARYPDDFLHCGVQWSPSSQFIAFNVGACNFGGPGSIAIFDIEMGKVVEVLPPIFARQNYYSPYVIGWLSATELIYSQFIYFAEFDRFVPRYFTYSIEAGVSRELAEFLPIKNADGSIFELLQIDWTSDGKNFVGVVITGKTPSEFSWFLNKVDMQTKTIDVLESENRYNNGPILSLSGNWIAYYSAPSKEETGERGVDLRISTLSGHSRITGINNLLELTLHYGWIKR